MRTLSARRFVRLLAVFGLFLAGVLIPFSWLTCCGLSRLPYNISTFDENSHHRQTPSEANGTDSKRVQDSDSGCAGFPDTSRVLLVIKTGASEAYNKIPNQILTSLSCHTEFFIFSDMAQNISGYTVFDSLDTVLPEVRSTNKDFDLYFRQQNCPVDQESCNKYYENTNQEAWKLDKYKNVHIAEKTYTMRPNYSWYFFVDADTYVSWLTLIKWLERLDPAEPHYIGSARIVTDAPEIQFGHGGSGYLVSQATMRRFLQGQTGVANRWDKRAMHESFGDYLFALALKTETDISLKPARSTLQEESPHTAQYSQSLWCQPLVTMHHVGAEELSDLYSFEKERNFSYPIRIKDIYHRFVKNKLPASRDDWDNLSETVFYLNSSAHQYSESELSQAKKEDMSALEMVAHQSFDDCRKACESLDNCLQYRLHNGICAIGDSIRHGVPTKKEKGELQYKSGWNMERIQQLVEHQHCNEIVFPVNG